MKVVVVVVGPRAPRRAPRVSAVQVSAAGGFAVLDAGAVVGEHGGPRVAQPAQNVGSAHLTAQAAQQDVAVGVDLSVGVMSSGAH